MMAQHFFAEFRNRQEAENNKQNFLGKKKQKTRFELESWRLRPRLSLD